MKIAVFDIGTNSIHMLIVEILKDLSFRVLAHEKDNTRLGDGSFETRKISRNKMQRAIEVMERFHRIAKKAQVKKVIAVATSAVREAKNGGELIDAIFKKSRVKVQVITGEEEARLIFLGARSSVDIRDRKALVVDIGGGSVELIVGSSQKIFFMESFKLGALRLTEYFLSQDPPSRKELRKLQNFIRKELKKAVKKIGKMDCSMVIGTSGTMINLASLAYEICHSRPLELVNHFELLKEDFEKAHKKLLKTSLEQRLKFPGLDPRRADIILAGSVFVDVLMELLKFKKITLSDKGIREGLIVDFIEKNKRRLRGERGSMDIRRKSIWQLLRRCSTDQDHAVHVAKLSLELFDQAASLHHLGRKERELLEFSSLLHDIGHYVSFQKHHRHSYYLIVNSDLDGFSPEEVGTIGAVARYHRKKAPKDKDPLLAAMNPRQRSTTKVLSAFLRIADGLDRTHFGVVQSVRCKVLPRTFEITLHARQDAELEIWQAGQRVDLFEDLFGKKVVFKTKR
jgi:exopolyphosphatase/guanosine-5'-triphosphate,3'-diphosphate pyrophosphatase